MYAFLLNQTWNSQSLLNDSLCHYNSCMCFSSSVPVGMELASKNIGNGTNLCHYDFMHAFFIISPRFLYASYLKDIWKQGPRILGMEPASAIMILCMHFSLSSHDFCMHPLLKLDGTRDQCLHFASLRVLLTIFLHTVLGVLPILHFIPQYARHCEILSDHIHLCVLVHNTLKFYFKLDLCYTSVYEFSEYRY